MLSTPHRLRWSLAALSCALVFSPVSASAQNGLLDGLGGGFGGFGAGAGQDGQPVEVSAQFTAATTDSPAVLMVTASIEPDWHVYSITQGKLPSGLGPQQTTITVPPSAQYKLIGAFRATPEPEKHVDTVVFEGLTLEEHADQVTWYAPIELAEGVDPATLSVGVKVSLQACHDAKGCVPHQADLAATLGAGVPIGPLDMSTPAVATVVDPTHPAQPLTAPSAGVVAGEPYDLNAIRLDSSASDNSLFQNLLLAFGGGLLLNLMPCVLPVIGLKVMSFVQQAGYSRGKALELNLWYSLGIVSVFWVLAGLAAAAGVSWGEQFSSVTFNVVMASIVFAMALSLLGVWEFHVPDAVGRTSTHKSVQGEGRVAALLKGVLTTLLATPCTGPGMAVALGWAVKQPSGVIFAVFTALGLGMASPYLVIGAFPRLVNFLPKPGEWMVTFKQLMGFVLLGTVIFLLSLLPSNYLLPSICLMTAIGLAAWVYSQMPIGAPWSESSQTYALSGAIIAAGAVFAFAWLAPLLEEKHTVWDSFSLAKLNQAAVEEGKTVLVDFGADWCANCQVLEKTVLHTAPVEEAIKRNGVVPMFGDNTYYPPEIKETLSALGANGVPVIAIFPGGAPYEPIIFQGFYTQGELIDAIAEAKTRKGSRVTRTASGPPNTGER